jgi:hypothetical protein
MLEMLENQNHVVQAFFAMLFTCGVTALGASAVIMMQLRLPYAIS